MQLEMQTYIRLYAKKRCPLLTTKVTSMRGTFSQKEQGGKFGIRKEQRRIVERYEGSMNLYYDEKDLLFHTIILLRQPYPSTPFS